MKKFSKILLSLLCAALIALPVFAAACSKAESHVDYASQLTLDFTSTTKKQEVTVNLFIDGDTTHFVPVDNSSLPGCDNSGDFAATHNTIKARYLAVNTPESTGQIEEWGKKASKFTRSKLENVQKIVVEADADFWDIDSTGERYLLWIWYLPNGATEYRNLNLELLQEGLAYASRTAETRYGEIASAALAQAEREKLNVFSGEKDPDFYYGQIKEVDLRELRCFAEEYEGTKIRVSGTIVASFGNSVYIEAKDLETGDYFGMPVYYGFTSGRLLDMLKVGNEVSVVGTLQYYEAGGTYQISGVAPYNAYEPDDPSNCHVLNENIEPAFTPLNVDKYLSTQNITIKTNREDEEGNIVTVDMLYSESIMSTSVSVDNLYVYSAYTTHNGGDSDGAMTLYCRTADNKEIQIRTDVLKDSAGTLLEESDVLRKTINVKGIIEKYDGNYQIKVYRYDFIDIVA